MKFITFFVLAVIAQTASISAAQVADFSQNITLKCDGCRGGK